MATPDQHADIDALLSELAQAIDRDDDNAAKRAVIAIATSLLDDVRRIAAATESIAESMQELT